MIKNKTVSIEFVLKRASKQKSDKNSIKINYQKDCASICCLNGNRFKTLLVTAIDYYIRHTLRVSTTYTSWYIPAGILPGIQNPYYRYIDENIRTDETTFRIAKCSKNLLILLINGI